MRQITLQYYAIFREQAGVNEEQIRTEALTPAELYRSVKSKYKFTLPEEAVKVAVNDAFSDWDVELKDGDTVLFIPPVAGG